MPYSLLCGGYRDSVAVLAFDGTTLSAVKESRTPPNPSWIEPSSPPSDVFFSLSEQEGGSAVSLKLEEDKSLTVTATVPTHGAPCHVHALQDGSGVIVANYVGGSVLFVPVVNGVLGTPAQPLVFPFAYSSVAAPNPARQDASHAHGTVEADGRFYTADLGSDRVWILRRADTESGLEILDHYQCAPGWGPRHLQVAPDGRSIWVLGEMGHGVCAFPIPGGKSSAVVPGSTAHVLPSSVPDEYKTHMDGAELILHKGSLYASNRLEREASAMNPQLPKLEPPRGDTVAVVLIKDGNIVEEVRQVRTGCDSIRGMQVSPDGKFVAVAGMSNGVVEVYAISGERGEEWAFVTSAAVENVTDFVWVSGSRR